VGVMRHWWPNPLWLLLRFESGPDYTSSDVEADSIFLKLVTARNRRAT
jgi:hypothetical protein